MSAIFGIHTIDGHPSDPAELQRLLGYLARRGPDAAGVWAEPGIALGNCLLRTTPESLHEKMPATNTDRSCYITADARLDNRDELIRDLGFQEIPPNNIPDSTLILAAYQKWGDYCPTHLLGDFAFAIWDCETRTLFCARDHFGIKPFYYVKSGPRFAFCSCIDGLLKLDWIPRRLNELRLANHLTTFFGDTAATFYADIVRLPPAHSLRVNEHGVRLAKYWTLNPACETRFNSDQEYVEAFRALFQEAVRTRLRTAGRAGSMLSGGLDSSSITAMAGRLQCEQGRRPLATFSAVFDEVPRSNERRFVTAAVESGGFEASYLAADQCNPFLAPPEVAETQAEVHVATNMFLNWGLYSLARKRGVQVVLDGFDGDTTISHGVTYLLELARANEWLELSRLVKGAARTSGCSTPGLLWAYVWHQGLLPKIPSQSLRLGRGVARRWRSTCRGNPACDCVLDREFVKRVGFREYRDSLRATAPPPAKTEKEAHYQTLAWGVMPATLEMLDQAAAPFGIELRFPFWDRRLIEFCLGLPPRLKIHGGYTRWILRKAMDGILPREVQWRPDKSNLGHAFNHCLFKHGYSALTDAITAAQRRLRPYVCAHHFDASRRCFMAGRGERQTLFLWQMANLSRWLERTGIQA
ncbi:MAG TPA: lasso peptide isopeptide bond-forming cyclase [Verrucomicrobiae bacterium]|jgi:asparagine synthase (glutamine-hydrolysing)|nr:lasso peptide isopeptide bond-forming cyclase [Verrucomicrobiae bacterium]